MTELRKWRTDVPATFTETQPRREIVYIDRPVYITRREPSTWDRLGDAGKAVALAAVCLIVALFVALLGLLSTADAGEGLAVPSFLWGIIVGLLAGATGTMAWGARQYGRRP